MPSKRRTNPESAFDMFWGRNRELKYILHLDEAKREVELGEYYAHGTVEHPPKFGQSPICAKCTSGTGPFCSGCWHLHQLPQYAPWNELRTIEALEHVASTGSWDAMNAYIAECRKQVEERMKERESESF